MSNPVIPTLTVAGWDTNPTTQMSKLFEYYQASDYSQSNTFHGRITSLQYTLSRETNPEALKKAIENDIVTLYGCYFDSVEPLVVVQPQPSETVRLEINIECVKDDNTYHLSTSLATTKGGSIRVINSKLTQLYKYNQYL